SNGTCGAHTAILTSQPLKVRACTRGNPPPSPLPSRLTRKSARVCDVLCRLRDGSSGGRAREQRVVERREKEIVETPDVGGDHRIVRLRQPLGGRVQVA